MSSNQGFLGKLRNSQTTNDPTFLMCPPTMYDVNYVINPWMEGNLNRSSIQDATRQWERLHTELSRLARVELVEQQAGSPDMVFTAMPDWFVAARWL